MSSTGIKSRLLNRLDANIAQAKDLTPQACLKVQRALLFARHGRMAEAREQLTGLHQLAFQHPNPEIGAWLHYAEGMMSYYTDFSSAAQEKIARAKSVAGSVAQTELAALCAAWLAQLAYVRHQPTEMLQHARECDALAAANHHAARYRLCTVMGLAHHYADQSTAAQTWYAKARGHASAEGDDALLSALMFNTAEMRTAQTRRESLSRVVPGNVGLLLGADSIRHYDAAVGVSAMPGLTSVLRAQVLTVGGEFAQAQALYEAHLPQAMSAGLSRLGSSLLADLAWCRVNTGQQAQALQQAREAESELDPACDIDDRAATHSRLAQVYAALGDAVAAERHATSAAAEWREFAAEQAAWAQALAAAGLLPR